MSEKRDNPAELYDADFVKKLSENEAPTEPEEQDDAFAQDSGLFSTRKTNLGEKDNFNAASPGKLDDINALLESVGISPIEEENEEKNETPSSSSEEEGHTKTIPELGHTKKTDDGKTKHFKLKSLLPSEEEKEKEKDGQLLLDGYEDDDEKPSTVSLLAVEKQLKKTRKNLIENFRVLSNETGDKAILEKEPTGEGGENVADKIVAQKGETLFDALERDEKKKKSLGLRKLGEMAVRSVQQKTRAEKKREALSGAKNQRKSLKERQGIQKKLMVRSGVLLGLSLILFFMLCICADSGSFSFLIFGNGAVFVLLNLLLLALGFFFGKETVSEGFERLRAFKPNAASFVLLSGLLSGVQALSLFFLKPSEPSGFTVFSPFFFFSLFLVGAAQYLRLEGVRRDLSVLMRCKSLRSVQKIENKADADSLGYGISEKKEPKIIYTADSEIPRDFERFSLSGEADEKVFRFWAIAALSASILFSVVAAVVGKSAGAFFNGLSSSFCLCAPVAASFVSALIKTKNDESLSEGSAVVASFDSAKAVAKATAVVVDADEIFEGRVSKFKTVPGEKMAVSDAVVFTAATLKKSRSVLKNEFDSFLEEERLRLPEAEELQYEEKLGYSCWIIGRRVLVGNRQMLLAHSIDAPSEEDEKKYAKDKSVMYLAVEGVIAATFVVDYRVRSDVRREVRTFNKTGLVLMLNCGDPCLTQELAAEKLTADIAAIKLSSAKNSELIDRYKSTPELRYETGLSAAKKDRNILLLINGAHDLFEADRLSKLILLSGLAFSFVLSVLCTVFKVSLAFNPVTLIVFQLAWGAVAYMIGKTRIH